MGRVSPTASPPLPRIVSDYSRPTLLRFTTTREWYVVYQQVAVIVAALKPATVTLCLDTNGNHVVQRLLQHLAPTDNEFVFEVGKKGGIFNNKGKIILAKRINSHTGS